MARNSLPSGYGLISQEMNAQARARGYNRENRNRPPETHTAQRSPPQETTTGQELVLFMVIIWALTWIVPAMQIYELTTYGWHYTYLDMQAHFTSGVSAFVGLCWLACLVQVFYLGRLCVK